MSQTQIVKRFRTTTPKYNGSWNLPGGEAVFQQGIVTELNAEQWEVLKNDALFLYKLENGDISEIGIEIPAISLNALGAKSSRTAIESCMDVKSLEDYARNATTPYLQKLIREQAQALMGRIDKLGALMPTFDPKNITFNALSPEEAQAAVEAVNDKTILLSWQKQSASIPTLQGIVNVKFQTLDKLEKSKEGESK